MSDVRIALSAITLRHRSIHRFRSPVQDVDGRPSSEADKSNGHRVETPVD